MIFTLTNRIRPEQQRLMKKEQGQIIHVSDFVKEENDYLIICDQEGNVVRCMMHYISRCEW
jgi:hypothetical protein